MYLRLNFRDLKIVHILYPHYYPKKNNSKYSKIKALEQVCQYSLDYTINHNENEDKNEKAIE